VNRRLSVIIGLVLLIIDVSTIADTI